MRWNRTAVLRILMLFLVIGMLIPLLPSTDAASLYTVKTSQTTTLAPGITQTIKTATYPNSSTPVKYYIATADINRGDVVVLNGYKDNNPVYNGCGTVTVDQQIIAAQSVHSDPSNARYIENFRVVAGCNGGFFNIPGTTGIPGFKGALVMEGEQYWEYDGRPFLAILKDGTAVVGSGTSDWNKYREHMQEAIGGNVLLVKNGVNNTGNVNVNSAFVGEESKGLGTNRHPRTCAGITKDGKIVMMVIDAQTTTTSSSNRGGATLNEAAQMLIDAGCSFAINMDGGGSSTYMTLAEGASTPTLVNKPSGGSLRAICGSLLFASTAPSDHLSFEFDGTGANRYITNLYCKRDYDQPAYWATGLSGTGNGDTAVSINPATGALTINLTKRADSHSTYLALGNANNTFDEATATSAVSLNFVPKDVEIVRIRLKLKDAKRYSSTDTPFVGFSYLSADTKTWSGNIAKATIPDAYLDGGASEDTYLTLTVDLSSHQIRNCSKISNIMLQIGYLREGGAFIDQIYLGPKSGNELRFGFSEDPNDTSNFNDPAYGYLNFDRELHWAVGPEISAMDINHGAMTLMVDNACGNLHEAYVQTTLSQTNIKQPLRYTAKAGDVIQVCYRVESYDVSLNSSTYGSSQKPTMTVYGFYNRQNSYKNPNAVTLNTSGRSYSVAEWTVPTEWTSVDLSMLRLTLRYFQNSTIKIDSVYVGPKAQAPQYDRLYLSFNGTAADRVRYTSTIYGGMNMDKIGNWSAGSELKPVAISGSVMKLTPATDYDGYGYAHSGSVVGSFPLSYVPKADDYLQVRFKLENAVARNLYADKTGIGRFVLYYGNASVGARNHYLCHDFTVADVTDKGWVTITYKIKDMTTGGTNMTAMSEITSISPCFNWVSSASGKTAAMYFDYIYIGPSSGMPTPMYTVTFKDGNGNVLMSKTVNKGQSVVYSGPSPTKKADANYHYTFKSWDKSASNITADTVITAQFNAVAHSFTLASVDANNHKASCSCGYSKTVAHSLTLLSVDASNHKASCSCGYSKTVAHSFTYSTTGDHNTHKRSCSCGYSDTMEGHQYSFSKYSAEKHSRTCAKCGFVDQSDHIFTYTSVDAKQHKRNCKWCGYEDTVAHTWNNGVMTTVPSYTQEGLKTYTCTACNATKTELVAKLSDALYFDFTNTDSDRARYNSAIYAYTNFDVGTWSWSARTEKPAYDNTSGTLSVTMLPDAANYNVYVQSSASLQANMNLRYNPTQAEYVQYRIKLENFTTYATPTASVFYYQEVTAPNGAGIQLVTASKHVLDTADLTSGQYLVITQPVTDAFRACGNISAIRLDLEGIKSLSNTQLGKLTVDYIYVGPKSSLPIQDSLLFDFGNTAADQLRYETKQYSNLNFDTANYWYQRQANMNPVSISNSAGTLTATLVDSPPNGEHYIQTSGSSTTATQPLIYVPRAGDYFQMRLKIDNAVLYDATQSMKLGVYYFNGTSWRCESAVYHKNMIGSGYFTVTIPLSNTFTSAKEITAIRAWFNNLTNASGKTASFTIDYIAIGQASSLRYTPYTVKFAGANGTVLDTQTVGKGDTVYYRGTTPTKASDATNHYSFKAWDKALTNISANTVINATFTATAHSYSYAKVDATNHKASCACGYSKTVAHTWDSGSVTTQPTCTAAGVKTYTCTACKQSKTETLSAIGHSWGNWKSVDNDTHKRTCQRSGCTASESESHVAQMGWEFIDIGSATHHDRACRFCEHIRTLSHAELLTYTDNNDGTHTAFCKHCLYTEYTAHSYVSEVSKQPTCTEAGTRIDTCTECKSSKTVPIAKLGHSYTTKVTPPTCTAQGYSTHTCSRCSDSYKDTYVAALGHTPVYADNGNKTHTVTCKNCNYTETAACEYENGKCICGAKEVLEPIYDDAIKFSHSLTLENDISINFIGLGSALSVYDTFYLECKVPVYNGNELVGYKTVNIEPVFNGKNYECTLLGVTAKMMNDDIEAVFHMTKDGQEYYSKTDVYSVAEYAYGKLDSIKATDTAELKAICANLLRYGSMAQTQFNYRTDALVDADMTDVHKAYLTDLSKVEMKDYRKQINDLTTVIVPWKSTTLELGNKVIMCLIANLANYSGDPSELTMRLSYTDAKGVTVTEERPLALYNPEALTYAVSYDGLRATEMRTIVSAAIYRNGERVSKTVEYSIESYGARSTDPAMQGLCRAMLAYGDSANAFFAN